MTKKLIEFLIVCLFWSQIVTVTVRGVISFENQHENASILVRKDERKSLVSTEYGEISAVNISDGAARWHYQLQFITLEPNALFLPVLLHSDMVFYVQTGSGRLSFVVEDEDEVKNVDLQRADVYRLPQGTVFFMQSNLEASRHKLRVCGLFFNPIQEFLHDPCVEAYSSIRDLVLGFDDKVLQAAFNVPAEVIEEITCGGAPPAIVHASPTKERTFWELEARFMKSLLGRKSYDVFAVNKKHKHKKSKLFNILEAKPDFENCNGWSLAVTKKDLSALKGSNIGLFMVNLTHGSMMGPHWNPMASEISIVMQGQGMIRMVCPATAAANESGCKNMSFRVGKDDVFVVPRFHPMAQMAFNNDSFVFMGFSTSTKKNHPQYLAGTASVLRTLDREIVAASFNVSNTTVSQLLDQRVESIILGCTSCAEEEERKMKEEIEREKEEERKRREEEKRRKEEEEEEKKSTEEEKKRKEEEEERKREEEKRREEAARKRAEEEAKKREEARKREEEEASRQEKEMEKEMERQEEDATKERERQKEEEKKEEEASRERERQKEEEDERKEEEAARRERERQKEEEAKGKEEEKGGGGGGGREGEQSRVVVSV